MSPRAISAFALRPNDRGRRELINQAERAGAEHDRNDVPSPAQHPNKCDETNIDRKPIDSARPGKSAFIANQTARFKTTPTTAAVIGGECGGELHVAAQFLDVRAAQKNPEKAGRERRPSGEQCAQRGREQRRQTLRVLPSAHEADELQDHDERSRRRFGETKSVHHLARLEPTVMKKRLLRDIRQHGVGAAEGDHGCFAKENSLP